MLPTYQLNRFINCLFLATTFVFSLSATNRGFATTQQDPDLKQALSQSSTWQRLLHFGSGIGGKKSRADGQSFFFSPNGKTDAYDEFEATVQALQSPVPSNPNMHPICRFPARTAFLRTNLNIALPQIECTDYQDWRRGLHARSISIVYSTAFPNAPVSMFGHLLIKVNANSGSDLMDYGINFGAIIDDTSDFLGLKYVFKGLFGGYKANMGIAPYYLKVAEYNHAAARDLWEYELNLSPDQVDFFLAHIWEIYINTHFDYYFFDENCAYFIGALLETILPSNYIISDKPAIVSPTQIMQSLNQNPNLIKRVSFRASKQRHFHLYYQALEKEQRLAFHYAANSFNSNTAMHSHSNSNMNSDVYLDTLIEYMHLQKINQRNGLSQNQNDFYNRALKQRILLNQSTPIIQNTPFTRPDQAHKLATFDFGVSRLAIYNSTSQAWLIGVKPGFQQLMDPQAGFEPFNEVSFLDITFAIPERSEQRQSGNDANERLYVSQFKPLKIVSLFPVQPFSFKPSWKVDMEYNAVQDLSACEPCKQWSLESGVGLTFGNSPFQTHSIVYSLLSFRMEHSPDSSKSLVRLPLLELGTLLDLSKVLGALKGAKIHMNFQKHLNITAMKKTNSKLELRIPINSNMGIFSSFQREQLSNRYAKSHIGVRSFF